MLQSNLITPATLGHKLDVNGYMLMQKQGCPEQLRIKFNNHCQEKLETACRQGDAHLAHKWFHMLSPHLPLKKIMICMKLLFDFSPDTFANMLSVVKENIALSHADQTIKREQLFDFLLDRLGKENNQLTLSGMIADFFNDTDVKKLINTTFKQGKFPPLLEQLKQRARVYVDTKPEQSNDLSVSPRV